MIYFNCDYSEGAHPRVLELLNETNKEQTLGYGEDFYCEKARKLIQTLCENESLDIHFLSGGTQTNLIAISASLRPHQGVICADTGHINIHETGAIEACGHKVLSIPSLDGKIRAERVESLCHEHVNDETHEHMVQPGMVYISNPTEVGTIYTKKELVSLSEVCRRNNLYLYLDGARLGYGFGAPENELDLKIIAQLCDLFYIGGTKQGALFGEALVLCNETLKKDFRYLIKQRGGLLAKGRILGIQFLALFEDNLYFTLGSYAVQLADQIRKACKENEIPFLYETNTNQLFPIFNQRILDLLSEKYLFSNWKKVDDRNRAVRICTSWATKEEDAINLIRDINYHYKGA